VGFTWTTALVNTFLLPWIAISLFTTNISFTHDLLKLRKPCQEIYSSIGINCMFSFMRRIKVQITFAQLSNFQKEKKKKRRRKSLPL
jgi:hypothetical protein